MKHGQGHVLHDALELCPSQYITGTNSSIEGDPFPHNSLGGIEIPYMNPIPSARYDPTKLQHSPPDNRCSTGVIYCSTICITFSVVAAQTRKWRSCVNVLSPAYLFLVILMLILYFLSFAGGNHIRARPTSTQ